MKLPEVVISLKYKGRKTVDLEQIRSSKDCAKVFRKLFDADTIEWKEEMIMICLSRQNHVIGWYKVAMGGTTGITIDSKIIFQVALNCNANQIIIAHNHPAGTLKPSQSDILTTDRIKQGGEILQIKLLDHLILTTDSYYSFADNGLI